MDQETKRVVLHSKSGYSKTNDGFLKSLIENKVLLFCAVGKDCELWHDVMDEFYIADGVDRDFFMITSWHDDETLDEVIDFAEMFTLDEPDSGKVEVIEI